MDHLHLHVLLAKRFSYEIIATFVGLLRAFNIITMIVLSGVEALRLIVVDLERLFILHHLLLYLIHFLLLVNYLDGLLIRSCSLWWLSSIPYSITFVS